MIMSLSWNLTAQAFNPQKLLQIPSQPGQLISSLQVDAKGNTIAAAVVTATSLFDVTSQFGLVMKIDPLGNQIFSRVLPGVDSSVSPLALALDKNGDVYVGGETTTPAAFPFTNVLYAGGGGFLVKLNAADGALAYAAELGGTPTSVTVDNSGQALLTLNSIVQLPLTPGAFSHGGPRPFSPAELMYVVRLSPAGDNILLSALYSADTIICATPMQCEQTSPVTQGSQIMEDAQGDIWIAGNTNTTDLPMTPNALNTMCGCSQYAGDGFLAEFSNDGAKLLYATYLGTSSPSDLSSAGEDDLTAAVMDSAGHIWMVGNTNGSDFPVTSNAIQQQLSGGTDGFVTEYDPATNKLLYASYFGGSANDSIANVQIAADGTVVLAGHSQSATLPIAASGFTRGPDFLATIDPQTYAGTFLTTFASGSVGSGLTSAPGGMEAISGTSNVVDFLQPGAAPAGAPSLYAVTNSANFIATGQVAAGELITLFGANIGPSTPATADLSSRLAPTQLGGVQVLVQNAPVPLLYAEQDQINAIIPFSPAVSPQSPAALTLTVKNGSANSNTASLAPVDADPEAFSFGLPYAAAVNQDGMVNSQKNAAAGGSIISVYATGLGGFEPPPMDGSVVEEPAPINNALVLYNGSPVSVTYAGQAPMLIAGVSQVNFVVPPSNGNISLTFQFDVNGWIGLPFQIWVK
jgi:uncharacterized protein (TIGR03437 family)